MEGIISNHQSKLKNSTKLTINLRLKEATARSIYFYSLIHFESNIYGHEMKHDIDIENRCKDVTTTNYFC